MAHVFISYAHVDADFVTLLKMELEKAGIDTWIDTERLRAGEDWRLGIDEAIRSAYALIVVMSPDAFESQYITYEWAFAWGLGIPLIPIMLNTTPLHPRLETLQYLDFTNRSERPWGRLMEHLQAAQPARQTAKPRAEVHLQKVQSAPERVRDEVFEGEIFETVQTYLRELEDQDSSALQALIQMGDEAFPALLDALTSDDEELQGKAAFVFERVGNHGRLFLLDALRDPRPSARLAAIRGLGILMFTDAVPGILRALRDNHTEVRGAASQALNRIGGAAVPELLNALSDLDVHMRLDAAWALGEIKSRSAVPGLLKALYDPSGEVRIAVADALGEIGATEALNGLLQVLDDADPRVSYAAVLALGRIGRKIHLPSHVLDRLVAALGSDDSDLRHITAAVLGELGYPAAVEPLLNLLRNEGEEERVRVSAASALGAIGSTRVVPTLVGLLNHPGSDLADASALALGSLGGQTAVTNLVAQLRDSDPSRRCSAARALGEIKDPATVATLAALLVDRHSSRRGERVCNVATDALTRIGTPEAVEAVRAWKGRR